MVLKGWSHLAKTTREDGSFATSDLFEPHPEIEGGWRYHSRSDSQITLITGKKFDPVAVEDAIVVSAGEIRDRFVFGGGRQVPGALVFVHKRMVDGLSEEEVKGKVWRAIMGVNERGQDHTRIARDMVVVKLKGKLENSGKGTLLRGAAEKKFSADIEAAYGGESANVDEDSDGCGREPKDIVREAVNSVLRTDELDELHR